MQQSAAFPDSLIMRDQTDQTLPGHQPLLTGHVQVSVPSQVVTPVRVEMLRKYLQGYPAQLNNYLLEGFSDGFLINFFGKHVNFQASNLKSALANPEIVQKKLQKELEAGRLAGPFLSPPFPVFRVSPLGVVPKKDPNEFRLIHHLSYPAGSSVNDGIPHKFASVQYATVDRAIEIIKTLGRGCFLAKTDIRSAFRIIPVSPKVQHLLGLSWEGKFYYDRCLPMGCSASCQIFESFSTAMEWISLHKYGAMVVIHILDDFLFLADTHHKCLSDLTNFLSLSSDLGVPIAHEKTAGPSTCLTFAGIDLGTIAMEAMLPYDKLRKCCTLIDNFLSRKSVKLVELQSLIGTLNFACRVIVPGRPFLRRLIDLTVGIKAKHHHIKLSQETKADLNTWKHFIGNFNGKTMFFEEKWETSVSLHLYTDAAQSLGFGAIFGPHWLFGEWPASWKLHNIATLEMYQIMLSLRVWGHKLANRQVMFFSDNQAVVEVLNRQTARDRQLMVFIRDIVPVCLKLNIMFRAKHIPGQFNTKADYLSRLQVARFKAETTVSDYYPTAIPVDLLPSNWQLP
ncbi:uncharacterized protein LOC144432735 [Glandiceps talaboti]